MKIDIDQVRFEVEAIIDGKKMSDTERRWVRFHLRKASELVRDMIKRSGINVFTVHCCADEITRYEELVKKLGEEP
jgi:hypothetical protein